MAWLEKTLPEAFSRVVFGAAIVWYPGFGGFTRFYRIDAVVPRSLMHRRCQMPLAQPWSFSEKLLWRVMRCALWRMRSQIASAWFGSPIASCHCLSALVHNSGQL